MFLSVNVGHFKTPSRNNRIHAMLVFHKPNQKVKWNSPNWFGLMWHKYSCQRQWPLFIDVVYGQIWWENKHTQIPPSTISLFICISFSDVSVQSKWHLVSLMLDLKLHLKLQLNPSMHFLYYLSYSGSRRSLEPILENSGHRAGDNTLDRYSSKYST